MRPIDGGVDQPHQDAGQFRRSASEAAGECGSQLPRDARSASKKKRLVSAVASLCMHEDLEEGQAGVAGECGSQTARMHGWSGLVSAVTHPSLADGQ